MKKILFASVAVIALASCSGSRTSAVSLGCPQEVASLNAGMPLSTACPFMRDPSYANPTGEVVYGPGGVISLFAPHSGAG